EALPAPEIPVTITSSFSAFLGVSAYWLPPGAPVPEPSWGPCYTGRRTLRRIAQRISGFGRNRPVTGSHQLERGLRIKGAREHAALTQLASHAAERVHLLGSLD